jgi:hypothetical protein
MLMKQSRRSAQGCQRSGWHTFLQKLLRHADIRTTMNIYTQANSEQKRQAHSRIVQLVLPEGFAGAETRLLPLVAPQPKCK